MARLSHILVGEMTEFSDPDLRTMFHPRALIPCAEFEAHARPLTREVESTKLTVSEQAKLIL